MTRHGKDKRQGMVTAAGLESGVGSRDGRGGDVRCRQAEPVSEGDKDVGQRGW